MNKDFTRLISDADYRETFFQRMDNTIMMLRDNGYYEAVKAYLQARNRFASELRQYGIDAEK